MLSLRAIDSRPMINLFHMNFTESLQSTYSAFLPLMFFLGAVYTMMPKQMPQNDKLKTCNSFFNILRSVFIPLAEIQCDAVDGMMMNCYYCWFSKNNTKIIRFEQVLLKTIAKMNRLNNITRANFLCSSNKQWLAWSWPHVLTLHKNLLDMSNALQCVEIWIWNECAFCLYGIAIDWNGKYFEGQIHFRSKYYVKKTCFGANFQKTKKNQKYQKIKFCICKGNRKIPREVYKQRTMDSIADSQGGNQIEASNLTADDEVELSVILFALYDRFALFDVKKNSLFAYV